MYFSIYSANIVETEGLLLQIEIHISNGLPSFAISGIVKSKVVEIKNNVYSAVKNSGFKFPNRKIRIKINSQHQINPYGLELPIALGILIAQFEIKPERDICAYGGLRLNGEVEQPLGKIQFAEAVLNSPLRDPLIVSKNCIFFHKPKAKIINANNLQIAFKSILKKEYSEPQLFSENQPIDRPHPQESYLLFSSQERVLRAIQIAIAGGHNLILHGPAGIGKTTLVRVGKQLLPKPSPKDIVEIAKIRNLLAKEFEITTPFIEVGNQGFKIKEGVHGVPLPTQCHKGFFFIDDLAQLRESQLLEIKHCLDNRVFVEKNNGVFKKTAADFTLFATSNLCPCGNYGSEQADCRCSPGEIARYKRKLNDLFLSRIDVVVNADLQKGTDSTKLVNLSQLLKKIDKARELQYERYLRVTEYSLNSRVPVESQNGYFNLSKEAEAILKKAKEKLPISICSEMKIMQISRTIADLDNSLDIDEKHMLEAISFRKA